MTEVDVCRSAPFASPSRPRRDTLPPTATQSGENTRAERRSVLVVEDEALLAFVLAETLEDASFEVIGIAATAEEAFAAVEKRVPDLVLMDIRLKGTMDGIEAARRLTGEYNLGIIFVTGHSDPATRARAEELKPAALLIKPVTPKRLLAAVRNAFGNGH